MNIHSIIAALEIYLPSETAQIILSEKLIEQKDTHVHSGFEAEKYLKWLFSQLFAGVIVQDRFEQAQAEFVQKGLQDVAKETEQITITSVLQQHLDERFGEQIGKQYLSMKLVEQHLSPLEQYDPMVQYAALLTIYRTTLHSYMNRKYYFENLKNMTTKLYGEQKGIKLYEAATNTQEKFTDFLSFLYDPITAEVLFAAKQNQHRADIASLRVLDSISLCKKFLWELLGNRHTDAEMEKIYLLFFLSLKKKRSTFEKEYYTMLQAFGKNSEVHKKHLAHLPEATIDSFGAYVEAINTAYDHVISEKLASHLQSSVEQRLQQKPAPERTEHKQKKGQIDEESLHDFFRELFGQADGQKIIEALKKRIDIVDFNKASKEQRKLFLHNIVADYLNRYMSPQRLALSEQSLKELLQI